jgi:hypothetical protein
VKKPDFFGLVENGATKFWLNQCENANSLINCALYETKKIHYAKLQENGNAFSTYWRGDELRSGWKTYRCSTTYPEIDLILKQNVHYKAMAAQSAQQTLKSVGESITAYNGLVKAYYNGEVDKPSLPKYRSKGGLAAVTFPRGSFRPRSNISLESPALPAGGDVKSEWCFQLPIGEAFFALIPCSSVGR